MVEGIRKRELDLWSLEVSKEKGFLLDSFYMRVFLSVFVCLFLSFQSGASDAVDPRMPYGRSCVSVYDETSHSEVEWKAGALPGAGRSIRVHLDANGKADCSVLVVAFSKAMGGLANGWKPVLVELGSEGFEEKRVPVEPERWSWESGSADFEIYVVFLSSRQPATRKLANLVEKLVAGAGEESLVKLQTRQLREQVLAFASGGMVVRGLAGSGLTKLGGTVRAVGGFSWQEAARKIPFTEEKPGVTVFRHVAE